MYPSFQHSLQIGSLQICHPILEVLHVLFLCTQFSSELLSVTHSTGLHRFQSKIHLHIGTLLHHYTRPAFVFHSNFCFLLWWMRNAIGDFIQAKKHLPQLHGAKGSCRIKFGLSADSPSHWRLIPLFIMNSARSVWKL